jgi:hypothetical protein
VLATNDQSIKRHIVATLALPILKNWFFNHISDDFTVMGKCLAMSEGTTYSLWQCMHAMYGDVSHSTIVVYAVLFSFIGVVTLAAPPYWAQYAKVLD